MQVASGLNDFYGDALNTAPGHKSLSVYETVGIEILTGQRAAGTLLPPQRDWGQGEVRAAPSTVNKSYAHLEEIGLVFSRPGGRKTVATGAAASESACSAAQKLIDVARSDAQGLESTILLLKSLWRRTETTQQEALHPEQYAGPDLPLGWTPVGDDRPREADGPEDDAYDHEHQIAGDEPDDGHF